MSLRPNVTPFVPRQRSTAPSKQANASQSSSLKLSAEVAEFVPSWLTDRPTSSQDHAYTPSDAKATKSSKPSRTKGPGKTETRRISVTATPKPSSFKTSNVKNSSKKSSFKQEPVYRTTTAQPRLKNDENNIESDFPALGSPVEEDKTTTTSTVWSKPVAFGATFSDKLKSPKLDNTSSYSYNEPPKPFNDRTKERETTSKKSKEPIGRYDKVEEIEVDSHFNRKSADNIEKSEDEGFSVVRNRSKKIREMIESNYKEDNYFGQDKRRVAWSEDQSHERTNGVTKTGKKSSENQSKTSRERSDPVRDTYGAARDTHRPVRGRYGIEYLGMTGSSASENWRSGKKDRDSSSKDGGSSRTRQSFQQPKDYYTPRSTHRVSDSESSGLRNKEKKSSERLEYNSAPRENVFVNVSTAQARPPLSYSDILKSKPSFQLPNSEKVGGNERGILRIPSGASGEEDVDGQEVEAQEGKTKKKKKKKKKKKSEAEPQAVKKSKEALTLDVGDMLTKYMESSSTKKKVVIRTGGFLPTQAPLPPKQTRIAKKFEPQASNVLDSTAPLVFRSKEREFPKKKKPSAMRKILIKEREEKKLTREGKSPTEQSSDDERADHESSDEQNVNSDDIDQAEVKKSIHSRKFREYCDQDLDYDINGVVIMLLKELIRFQDRLYHKDPIKAKARRRFVCGLREVHKHAKLKKLKCVIVTPNLEPTKSKGGLDDLLSNIIDVCHSQNVPVIFSLNRQVLGKVLLKKVPVSIVGIFYYDGAQNYFKNLMILTEVARETYKDKFNEARKKFLLEKEMTRELALIEAGLHSTEIKKEIDQIVMYNDVKNVQANVETINEPRDGFGDEKREPFVANDDDNVNIENVAPDAMDDGFNTSEVNIVTNELRDSFGREKREPFLTNDDNGNIENVAPDVMDDGFNTAETNIETGPTNEDISFGDETREEVVTSIEDNSNAENVAPDVMDDGFNTAETNIETGPTNEDISFGDETREEVVTSIEDNSNTENVALCVMDDGFNTAETNIETGPTNEDISFGDETREEVVTSIEDNSNTENVALCVMDDGFNTAETNIETGPTNENSFEDEKRELLLTSNDDNFDVKNVSDGVNTPEVNSETTSTNENSFEDELK